ncbi:hypothetical protein [Kitasatospora sp. NPDC088548]|uniref:hypothetical protein n=1 Tax=Kitasatospora sp. NPDC088548 TaxID=3364075 RepID=UPI003824B575
MTSYLTAIVVDAGSELPPTVLLDQVAGPEALESDVLSAGTIDVQIADADVDEVQRRIADLVVHPGPGHDQDPHQWHAVTTGPGSGLLIPHQVDGKPRLELNFTTSGAVGPAAAAVYAWSVWSIALGVPVRSVPRDRPPALPEGGRLLVRGPGLESADVRLDSAGWSART